MTGTWTVAALIAGGVALLAAAVCVGLVMRLQRAILSRQQALEAQASALDDAVRMVEARLAELHAAAPAAAGEDSETEVAAALGDAPAEEAVQQGIRPEVQVVIAAAAVAAAGPNARVTSARRVIAHDDGNAWSQQGRVLVQTSHNLRQG